MIETERKPIPQREHTLQDDAYAVAARMKHFLIQNARRLSKIQKIDLHAMLGDLWVVHAGVVRMEKLEDDE